MNTTKITSRELYEQMKLRNYDAVIETAMRECGVKSHKRAKELLDAFLQWFALIPEATPEQPLQMLRSVDRIWHAMVLNTKFYREFCDEFFGCPIDHNPLDVVRNPKNKAMYAKYTLELVKKAYGENANLALFALREDVTCCMGCGPVTPTNPRVENFA